VQIAVTTVSSFHTALAVAEHGENRCVRGIKKGAVNARFTAPGQIKE